MFGIGGWEFMLIAVLALLLFGPDKLPEFARTIGRLMRDFKRYQDLMESTIRAEVLTTEPAPEDPFKKGKEFREKVESGEITGARPATAAAEGAPSTSAAAGESESAPEASVQDAEGGGPSAEAPVTGVAPESAGGAGESSGSDAQPSKVKGLLPPDHPLAARLAAGEDIGIDEDMDLSQIDEADIGWVPGRGAPGEEVDGDEA